MAPAPTLELRQDSTHGRVQSIGARLVEDGRSRIEVGSPQDLVGEHVAESGDPRLIEEHGLDRRPSTDHGAAEVGSADVQCIGTEPGSEVRSPDAGEPPRVRHDQLAATEGEAESQPSLVVGRPIGQFADRRYAVHDHPARHPEMDVDGNLAGVNRHHLAVSSHRRDPTAHQIGDGGPIDHQRVGVQDALHGSTHHGRRRPAEELDLEDLGHVPILSDSPARCVIVRRPGRATWNTGEVSDSLFAILGIAACGCMVWAAYRMEPHWASRDGRRFIGRAQRLGDFDLPTGRWHEVRVAVDGSKVSLDSRSRRGREFRGRYGVLARSPEPPDGKEIFVLAGEMKLLVRVPRKSRCVPVLRALMESSDV